MKRPNTVVNLIKAINRICEGKDSVRASRAMANVVVGQILPDGVIKGGSSLMFRYGERFLFVFMFLCSSVVSATSQSIEKKSSLRVYS